MEQNAKNSLRANRTMPPFSTVRVRHGRADVLYHFLKYAPILFLSTSGCSGNQSSLNPAGEQANSIGHLWWIFCGVMSVIYVLVLLFAVIAVSRRKREPDLPILSPDPKSERRLTIALGGFVGITVAILLYFMVSDFAAGRDMRALSDPNPLRVLVKGHQWWWEVQYENAVSSNIVVTANEIHLPEGEAVQFDLQASDVIHSFWSPNFDGKKDLVPGHPTSLWFRPTRLGTFYGQCAEFCGLQHAHMRFTVVVEKPDAFQKWLTAQSQSAPSPTNDLQRRGQQVFLGGTCIMCHTIAGTPARGTLGPDLTHLASRQMIGAGTIPNTRGHLGGWILDAPRIKPGVRMPQNALSPADFQALLAYLETLK
jgi:cytochrome c oxidase subunit II